MHYRPGPFSGDAATAGRGRHALAAPEFSAVTMANEELDF
jgi:hypothetical protein